MTEYGTDKSAGYINRYEKFFAPLVEKDVRLLELGVAGGGSLLLWRDYFKKGVIAGLDHNNVSLDDPTGRVRFYRGSQEDVAFLDHLAKETAPGGFDIIIDDCSHIGELTKKSFWHLFEKHLKSGGIYCIEDWGTGYWDSWVDGKGYKKRAVSSFIAALRGAVSRAVKHIASKGPGPAGRLYKAAYFRQRFPSHDYGLVGFIKELVDECASRDINKDRPEEFPPRVKEMHIFPGQVFLIKP